MLVSFGLQATWLRTILQDMTPPTNFGIRTGYVMVRRKDTMVRLDLSELMTLKAEPNQPVVRLPSTGARPIIPSQMCHPISASLTYLLRRARRVRLTNLRLEARVKRARTCIDRLGGARTLIWANIPRKLEDVTARENRTWKDHRMRSSVSDAN